MMLSHIGRDNQPEIVDISGKSATERMAHARTIMLLPPVVAEQFVDGELTGPKGPVFQTAIIAGIMGAKKTSELIPLCHPIGLDDCKIAIRLEDGGRVVIDCRTKLTHKTGVEMEALTGATVAALTIYDMCKGLSHDIVIEETRLMEKRGGKSDYAAPEA